MGTLFDQYAAARGEIPEYYQKTIQEAMEKRPAGKINTSGVIQNGKLRLADPVLDTYVQIAYHDTEHHLSLTMMPDEPGLDQRFPGMDPRGMHSRVDMAMEARLERLREAQKVSADFNAEILRGFFEEMQSGKLAVLKGHVREISKNVQHAEHAAKICYNREASLALEKTAKMMEKQSPELHKMDQILTAMEQVAGLRPGPLRTEDMELYNSMLGRQSMPLYRELPVGVNARQRAPKHVEMDFKDFNSVLEQKRFCKPKNWTIQGSLTGEFSQQSMDRAMTNYARGTANRVLDGLFSAIEMQNERITPNSANRASLVIVDGKTLNQRIQDEYEKLEDRPADYNTWFRDNYARLSGEIVASALMANKRVEAHVPDRNGKLPDEPVQLHKTGFTPSPLQPVTLNAWERFFGRFGFFKEKVAQARESAAFAEARKQLRENYAAVATEKQKLGSAKNVEGFFGRMMRKNQLNDLGDLSGMVSSSSAFRMSRTAQVSACVCLMAAQGHKIEDIMNMDKLHAERNYAMETYLDHAFMDPSNGERGATVDQRKGDPRWLGSVLFHGQRALLDQVDEIMKTTDLSDPRQRMEKLPALNAAGQAMFDAYQEAAKNPQVLAGFYEAAYQAAGQNWEKAERLADQVSMAGNGVHQYFKLQHEADVARSALAWPSRAVGGTELLVSLAHANVVDKMLKESNRSSFRERLPDEATMAEIGRSLMRNETLQDMGAQMDLNPRRNLQERVRMLASGEFEKELTASVKLEKRTVERNCAILSPQGDKTTVQPGVQNAVVDMPVETKVTVGKKLQSVTGYTAPQARTGRAL